MEKFSFVHLDTFDGVETGNSKTFSAEWLPDVLAAFRDFLVASGFTYVTEVTAVYQGNGGCSSEEVEEAE